MGFLWAISGSVRAASEGARRSCSQSWSVRTDTPSKAANRDWNSPVFRRTLEANGIHPRIGAIGQYGSVAVRKRYWHSLKELLDISFGEAQGAFLDHQHYPVPIVKPSTEFPTPSIVEIDGRSMEPTLLKGWTVLVDGHALSAEPGDVVLLKGGLGWIVHRVVWHTTSRGTDLLFHRGDIEGGIGISTRAAIRGRVVAVIRPAGAQFPNFGDLSAGFRRRFRWAQARCRVYSLCHSAARLLGLDQGRVLRAAGRGLRNLFL